MSDIDNGEESNDDELDQGGIASLRASARQGEKDRKENEDLKKRLTFLEAGIDPKSEVGELLFGAYKTGDDLTELKAKALRLGAIKAPETPPAGPTAEELAAQAAREAEETARQATQEAMGGGQPGGKEPPTIDPRDEALEEYQKRVNMGEDDSLVRADVMAKLLSKGPLGQNPDKRLLYDPIAHKALGDEADRMNNRGASRG